MLSGASAVAANGPTGKGGMALTLRLTRNELLLPDLRDPYKPLGILLTDNFWGEGERRFQRRVHRTRVALRH